MCRSSTMSGITIVLFSLNLYFCVIVGGFFLFDINGNGDSRSANVNVSCGEITGRWNATDRAFSFFGIPYAEPPVKKLRWKEPIPLRRSSGTCWSGILDASNPVRNQCYQPDPLNNTRAVGDEDCLYLNVWTPTLDKNASLPVMVWIHGGYLLTGNGNQEDIGYAPSAKLARELNMVFVSMNYRLNAFGFMALEILASDSPRNTSGNYGFMDQIEALKWIQENIRQFGGDPKQVTVFGQSSGGTSIFALLASPLTNNLFHRAWLQSASPVMNKTAAAAYKDNEVFLKNSGCTSLACLYNLTSFQVLKAVPWLEYPYWGMDDLLELPQQGRFDGALAVMDGYVLPEAPFKSWVHSYGRDVPVLIGSTAQEVDLSPHCFKNTSSATSTDYAMCVRLNLNTFNDVIAETALKLYPFDVISAEYQLNSMTSDARVTCGTDYMTLVASTSFTSPVYRYIATFVTSKPTRPFGGSFESNFAFHGVDSYAFFGTFDKITDQVTPRELHFQNSFRNEIISFVKTGSPATRDWKPYPTSTALVSEFTNLTDGYHTAECEFWLKNGFFSYSWIN